MIVQIGPLVIHVESLVLGVAVGVLCDRFLLAPMAVLMERVERRWHGRLRAR